MDAAQHSVLAQYLSDLLAKDATARSALPGLKDALKVTAVAAVFDALGRVETHSQRLTRDELQALLTELALRLLR